MSPSAWQPAGAGTSSIDNPEIRAGTFRASMKNNPLLAKADLGATKKMIFSSPAPDHVFGYMPTPDPEGAREITMIWKSHDPNAGADTNPDRKPKLDFTKMNKLASASGLTTAKELPEFRSTHPVPLAKKTGQALRSAQPLPSEKNPAHTYGMPGTYRSAQTVREKGAVEAPMKHIMQGAYQEEWLVESLSKTSSAGSPAAYVPPVPTRAAIGHAIGAQQKYLRQEPSGEEWKMSKFKTVPSKVTSYMGGPTTATATARSGSGDDDQHYYAEATGGSGAE